MATVAAPPADAAMDDRTLLAIVAQERRQSLGGMTDDELAAARIKALEYYLGEKFGNEVPGRSQVIDTVVADTVDSLLPSLLEIFCSGDEVVRFEPTQEQDEETAAQATDYVNYIVTQDNNAVLFMYQWFKDALLQKNGVVKVDWSEVKRQHRETYAALNEQAYNAILADKEVEVIEQAQNEDGTFFVVVEKSKAYGCPKIEPVPPEEFWISRDAKLGEPPRACGHSRPATVSDLLEMGFPQDLIDQIPDYLGSTANDEMLARDTVGESDRQSAATAYRNKQMRRVWVDEAYIRVDYDGDGIAELRRIVCGGDDCNVLLANEPADDDPFCAITPYIMPHRWFGLSVADKTADLQLLKSTLWRQMLDNLYLVNNPVTEVVSGQVEDLRELLTRRPGGAYRVKQAGATREIATPFAAKESFPMLEYIDAMRENRTGVTRYNQGLDANSLNKTATGVNMIISAGQQRQKLIARVFAETGVKQLFQKVLALVQKHQNEPRIIRLRGKYVPMDPRMWANRYDVSINVGLGTGDRQMQAQQLMALLPVDQQIVMMQGGINGPLVTARNIYAKLKRIANYLGEKNADAFYTDPETAPPPPPPPPDPQLVKAQVDAQKAQLEAMAKQKELELRQVEMQMKAASDQQKAQLDIQKAALERDIKLIELQMKAADAQFQRDHDTAKLVIDAKAKDMEFERRDREHADTVGLEREKFGEEQAKRRIELGESPADGESRVLKELAPVIGMLAQAVDRLAQTQAAEADASRAEREQAAAVRARAMRVLEETEMNGRAN